MRERKSGSSEARPYTRRSGGAPPALGPGATKGEARSRCVAESAVEEEHARAAAEEGQTAEARAKAATLMRAPRDATRATRRQRSLRPKRRRARLATRRRPSASECRRRSVRPSAPTCARDERGEAREQGGRRAGRKEEGRREGGERDGQGWRHGERREGRRAWRRGRVAGRALPLEPAAQRERPAARALLSPVPIGRSGAERRRRAARADEAMGARAIGRAGRAGLCSRRQVVAVLWPARARAAQRGLLITVLSNRNPPSGAKLLYACRSLI